MANIVEIAAIISRHFEPYVKVAEAAEKLLFADLAYNMDERANAEQRVERMLTLRAALEKVKG